MFGKIWGKTKLMFYRQYIFFPPCSKNGPAPLTELSYCNL